MGQDVEWLFFDLGWESEWESLYPDAKRCLERLAGKYRLGVIANQNIGTVQRLRAFGIDRYFEEVIASAEEGLAKPNPAIFRLALHRAGCSPSQAGMVGDRLDNDIAPANLLGMTTFRVMRGFGSLAVPAGAHGHGTVDQGDGTIRERPDIGCDGICPGYYAGGNRMPGNSPDCGGIPPGTVYRNF